MAIETRNPATGELLRVYPEIPIVELCTILDKARADFLAWRTRPVEDRVTCLREAARLLRANAEPYAASITREMGKPVTQSLEEIEKSARCCDFFADEAISLLAEEHVWIDGKPRAICSRPLGTVLAITSWNYPFWQVVRIAVSALAAGNAVVLKHASNVPECALSLEALFHSAGFPLNLFRTLMVTGRATSVAFVHEHVHAIGFTGTTSVGQTVAAQAGSQVRKCVLELSGSDPYLVLADADIALAARECAAARMVNAGQSCAAAKRIIVEASVLDAFTEAFLAEMSGFQPGDPSDPKTRLGPLGKESYREQIHRQVTTSAEAGARLLLGGKRPNGSGFYYPATVLDGVAPGMPVADEETFGPVAAILPARHADEAVELANASPFGMNGVIFSRDLDRAAALARDHLDAGTVMINARVRSTPELPFGGVKKSGYGRELGAAGIREWCNTKVIG